MGPKYLQVAIGQKRSFSLSETKLSCNAESSIAQMFFVFAVGHNQAATRSSKKKKKKSPYDHSKPSLTSRMTSVINTHFISSSVWNIIHGRPTTHTKQRESKAKREKPNLRQFISCHRCGLCPAKNAGAFPFVCLSQQHMQVFGRGAQISGGLLSPSGAFSWRWGTGHPCVMERNASFFWNVKQIWQRTKTRSVSKHCDWPFNLSVLVPSGDDLCTEDHQNDCTGPKGEG